MPGGEGVLFGVGGQSLISKGSRQGMIWKNFTGRTDADRERWRRGHQVIRLAILPGPITQPRLRPPGGFDSQRAPDSQTVVPILAPLAEDVTVD